MWKNKALAGAKLSVDMFLGGGQGEGANSRMMGIPLLGERPLFSLGMTSSPDRKKMTVMFSLACDIAWRRKRSRLVRKPGQTHSLQPVQRVRYVQGQFYKRNSKSCSPGVE